MHVCYLFHKEFPQNNATGTNEFPRILSNLGIDVTVIAAKTAADQPRRETIDGVDVHRIPTDKSTKKSLSPTVFAYRGLRKLDQLCQRESIDILQMSAFPNLGFVLRPIPWFDSPPAVIVDIRGAAASNWFWNRVSKAMLNVQAMLVDNITTLDPLMAEHILGDHASPEIVPLGADLDHFHPGNGSDVRRSLGLSSEDIVFGYTGVLNQSRELDRLIDAFDLAHETHSRTKLVLVGDGDDRAALERQAAKSGCADAVLFTGEVPFADVPRYVRAFDVGFAYIPDRQPYRIQPPIKTVEFLATGLPVLATDTPGNQRFVEDDENGVLCSDSQTAYADAIRELVDSPAKRERLAASARESVHEYDYTNIVTDRLLPFYERVTDTGFRQQAV